MLTGLMWGEYDTPPSPVAVGSACNGVTRDPLAEQLAKQTAVALGPLGRGAADGEHIYQEIRPNGPHQNGGPVALRGRSEAFQ